MRTSSPKVETTNKKPIERNKISPPEEEVSMSEGERRIWIFFLITASIITTISDLLGLTGVGIIGTIIIIIYPATINTLFAVRLYMLSQFDIWDAVLGILGLIIPGSNLFRFLMKIRKWEQIAEEAKQKIKGGGAKSSSLSVGKIKQIAQIRTTTGNRQVTQNSAETTPQSSQNTEIGEPEETLMYESEEEEISEEKQRAVSSRDSEEAERIEEILPGEKTYFQENTQQRYKKLIETTPEEAAEEPRESKVLENKKEAAERQTKKPSPARIALEGRSKDQTNTLYSNQYEELGAPAITTETEPGDKQIKSTTIEDTTQRKTTDNNHAPSIHQETESSTDSSTLPSEKTAVEKKEKLQEERNATIDALLRKKEYEREIAQTKETYTQPAATENNIYDNTRVQEQKNEVYPTFKDIAEIREIPIPPEYTNESIKENTPQEIPLPVPEKTENIDVNIYEQNIPEEAPTLIYPSGNQIQSKKAPIRESVIEPIEKIKNPSKSPEQFTEIEKTLFETPTQESEKPVAAEPSQKITPHYQKTTQHIQEIRQKAAQKARMNHDIEQNQLHTKNQENQPGLRADQIREKIAKERAEKEKARIEARRKQAKEVAEKLTADILADIEKASGKTSDTPYTEKHTDIEKTDDKPRTNQNNTINLKDIPRKKAA